MAKISDFKVRGLTSASATIATVDVEQHSDGSWRFTIGTTMYMYMGDNAAVNALLEKAMTGTGGITSSALFGNTGV